MIIFPSRPGDYTIDPSFEAEANAAKSAGHQIGLVDVEMFSGDVRLYRCPLLDTAVSAIYRGWILKQTGYERFFKSDTTTWLRSDRNSRNVSSDPKYS